jgi:hypothetical protein
MSIGFQDTHGRTSNDYVEKPVFDPSKINEDDGSNPPQSSTTVSVNGFTQAVLDLILMKQGIHGGDTIGDDDPSAGTADGGFNPAADPNAPLIYTTEPAHKTSAMSDLISRMMDKPVFEDASWIGKDKEHLITTKDGWSVIIRDKDKSATFYDKDGNFVSQVFEKSGDVVYADGSVYVGESGDMIAKPKGTQSKYVDPESSGSYGGLPFPDGKVGNNHSVPAGLGIDLGLVNSLVGGNATFGLSGLAKLDLGGKGGDIGSLTDLDAIFGKFGNIEGFDLDNFGAHLKSDQDFVLDLDGNGRQDIIEWAIDTVVTSSEEQQTIADLFQDNAAYAEMKAIFLANLAEHHII